MHDVVVVGGGPGGLYAAVRLAARGIDVTVCEEHPTIGAPVHCTGILADEAFVEFDLPSGARLNDVRTARFVSPSGLTIEYTTPDVEAVVVDRGVFDQSVAQRALAAGARIEQGARVAALAIDAAGVTVDLEGGRSLRARAVVLACGASYALQRRLGIGMPRAYLQSAQAELPCARAGDVEVYFGSEVAPGGFAWVVPVRRRSGPHARIGVMAARDAGPLFQALIARVADAWGVDRSVPVEPRRRMLPLAPIDQTYADRVVVIGDAAGLVKATTGGGIYYSLVSASLAADVLAPALAADRLDAQTLADYERRWRRRCAGEFDAQLQLRELAERLTDRDIDGLFTLAQTGAVMPLIRRTARFNRHRDLIVALFKHPPARRLLFRHMVPA